MFVLPSHGEGWGRPIMEAMAAGIYILFHRLHKGLLYTTVTCQKFKCKRIIRLTVFHIFKSLNCNNAIGCQNQFAETNRDISKLSYGI